MAEHTRVKSGYKKARLQGAKGGFKPGEPDTAMDEPDWWNWMDDYNRARGRVVIFSEEGAEKVDKK